MFENPSQETHALADGALKLARGGPIATLELSRPDRRNAISQAMWRALPEAIRLIEADESCRVVVVRGAGGAFSAGADIGEFPVVYADSASAAAYTDLIRRGVRALRDVARPTIALIDGVCVGGGCALALACDLRFASENARFAVTPAKLGLAYGVDDTARLVEKVGPARAKDILFSGRLVEASEAFSIGLVDRLAEPSVLESITLAYAAQLAALSQSSIRTIKATVNSIAEGGRDRERIERIIADCLESADFREGYSAFIGKRPPKFG